MSQEMKQIAPAVGTIFEYKDRRYRVKSWFKEIDVPRSDDWIDDILYDANHKNKNGKNWQWCARKEATHVSGSGVGGCIAPISEIKITGRVNWSEDIFKEQEEHAIRQIGGIVF